MESVCDIMATKDGLSYRGMDLNLPCETCIRADEFVSSTIKMSIGDSGLGFT